MDELPPILRANLQALQRRDPAMAERICLPVTSRHVDPDRDGGRYRVHRTWHRLAVDDVVLPDGDVLVFGVGMGEAVIAALQQGRDVLAWDRDPWLLRLLLLRHDLSRPLASGRLALSLGADLLAVPAHLTRWDHPFLRGVYRNEAEVLDGGLRERRALVAEGTLFVDDIADALRDDGWSVWTWLVESTASEELDHTARAFGAQVAFRVNHARGLAEACQRLGLPLKVWEIDPATDAIDPVIGDTSCTRVFTYRKAQVAAFEAANLRAEYLPLAADVQRRRPVQADEAHRSDLCFVGNSTVERGRRCQQEVLAAWVLCHGGDLESAAEGQRHLEAWLAAQSQDFSTSRVEAIIAATAPGFLETCRAGAHLPDPVPLVAEIAAADKRIQYVANLGQLGIHVWGDAAWKATEPYGAIYRGPAGHRDELTAIYSGSAIQIDVGRLYQQDMITMRVFDAMACGAFVLAEYSDALAEEFEIGVELDAYRDLQELLDKAERWLAHPEERAAVAAKGLAAVRERHTIRGRVARMLG
jgi:spore maturation protein CgeB